MSAVEMTIGAALSTAQAEMNRWEHVIQVWELAEKVFAESGDEFMNDTLHYGGFLDQIEVLIQGSSLYKGA